MEPPNMIPLAAYRESCKIFKENMSSQRPHIIIYKAAEQLPLLGWIFRQKSEIIYPSGYFISQHHTGTNVMLPKNFNSCDVKDLRNIVLIYSEANHTKKHIGR